MFFYEKIYKKYKAFDIERSQNRFEKLKNYSNHIYPKLECIENNIEWIVKQQIINFNKSLFFDRNQLDKIASKLDELHSFGLVHGDLCFSNIAFDKTGKVGLLDWEVSLEIIKNGKMNLRTTSYCLHPIDKQEGIITKKTDRFGLAALAMISLKGPSLRSMLSLDSPKNELSNYIEKNSNLSNTKLIKIIFEDERYPDPPIFDPKNKSTSSMIKLL